MVLLHWTFQLQSEDGYNSKPYDFVKVKVISLWVKFLSSLFPYFNSSELKKKVKLK